MTEDELTEDEAALIGYIRHVRRKTTVHKIILGRDDPRKKERGKELEYMNNRLIALVRAAVKGELVKEEQAAYKARVEREQQELRDSLAP